MKICIASVRDTGGTGYTLAHAINKITPEHQAINLRAQKSYINYPAIVDMGNYDVKACRKMIYKADVVVFLSAIKPLFDGLKLNKRKLRDKKLLVYETGSIWRYARKDFMAEADKLMRDYQIVLGEPGMFLDGEDEDHTPCPESAKILPPPRSFGEIRRRYGLCMQDQQALQSFTVPQEKVVFCHAPTSEEKKGSNTFYRAVTKAMQLCPELVFLTIRHQSWTSCLQLLSGSDVLLDQDPPWPVGYGAISIEASVFRLPVITRVDPRCAVWMEQHLGLKSPFIGWKDDEDLVGKMYHLTTKPSLRRQFGDMAYKFCKAVHDERPVVERFMKIVEAMN